MKTPQQITADSRTLEAARNAWMSLAEFRSRRRRHLRYTYGDQWFELTRNAHNEVVTEGELMTVAGRKPITNNLIRRMVKAVVGRYRNSTLTGDADPSDVAAECRRLNHLDETDARTLEEFLISGMAIHRVCAERRPSGAGVWIDNVAPDRFFCSRPTDSHGSGLELAGRLIDMSFNEVLMRYGTTPDSVARLHRIFDSVAGATTLTTTPLLGADSRGISFEKASNGLCRIIEVWTLDVRQMLQCHDPLAATLTLRPLSDEKRIAGVNRRRARMGRMKIKVKKSITPVWHCRIFAPCGVVLHEYDSPMADGSLPYAVKFYPMVDGDVHSLVEDVIDQQRYVNRLVTLLDHMMGTAAKGVLLFPEGCLPKNRTLEEVANVWAEPGGVIAYRAFQGAEPHQANGTVADIGARDMLKTQIQMFEDVSGVSRSMLGAAESSAVGFERYRSEVDNALVTINDLLLTYTDFIATRNSLVAKAI